jgi:hypothetical protein
VKERKRCHALPQNHYLEINPFFSFNKFWLAFATAEAPGMEEIEHAVEEEPVDIPQQQPHCHLILSRNVATEE